MFSTFFTDSSLHLQYRLRNDLYCVEWDVKLYYTIPYIFSSFTALWTETKSAQQRTACPYWQTHWL